MRHLQRRRPSHQPIDLNVIPLIDVVFFLLIFYVISTAFITEAALPVQRPGSRQAAPVAGPYVAVAIVRSGAIQVGGRTVDAATVQAAVAAALASAGTGQVVVVPDREAPTGLLLRVMDACTAAGAATVQVAATPEGG